MDLQVGLFLRSPVADHPASKLLQWAQNMVSWLGGWCWKSYMVVLFWLLQSLYKHLRMFYSNYHDLSLCKENAYWCICFIQCATGHMILTGGIQWKFTLTQTHQLGWKTKSCLQDWVNLVKLTHPKLKKNGKKKTRKQLTWTRHNQNSRKLLYNFFFVVVVYNPIEFQILTQSLVGWVFKMNTLILASVHVTVLRKNLFAETEISEILQNIFSKIVTIEETKVKIYKWP